VRLGSPAFLTKNCVFVLYLDHRDFAGHDTPTAPFRRDSDIRPSSLRSAGEINRFEQFPLWKKRPQPIGVSPALG